jgi:hypothetical protein
MTATLTPIVADVPTFSLATLRATLAELTAEHPTRAGRLVKTANIVAVRAIRPVYGIGWLVESETEAGKTYWVMPVDAQMTCDCQDYRQRGGPCKHALAVELFQPCERRDADANDPTGDAVIAFPTTAYTDGDRFSLTPLGMAALAAIDLA